ncbi:hypothetical protein [Blautia sp. MSJ-19]|uniref:hypothetical protein n=1 Tax=Blautia sp. MSJ-19 TaxID=2841517 RepID=UPI001C0ECADE|nr:hypothetical protein [Blautia sp. MSJ-19]MBU5480526.1 hypothetical protein [Blautia sp. MSJ-19]
MNDTKSTVKGLKKQLAAAVAMVTVAAVALGSSTYAWFVSNNTVTATTTTISAQSNAPFLKIAKDQLTDASTTVATRADETSVALYPAEVIANGTSPKFVSAYASAKDAATELANSRFNVGDTTAAVKGKYAIKQSFVIGTTDDKAGSFKNLKVSKVELTGNTTSSKLTKALSVLIVCGEKWAVYKASDNGAVLEKYFDNTSAVGNNTNGVLADTIAAKSSVTVDCYVFYDGSEEDVHTDNYSENLLTALGATVTFTATPVNTDGTAVDGANNDVTSNN